MRKGRPPSYPPFLLRVLRARFCVFAPARICVAPALCIKGLAVCGHIALQAFRLLRLQQHGTPRIG